jgi:FMN-dependent NADH-azoreductase
MPTLLRIDASARSDGSRSRQLADYFQARWAAATPGGRVVVRDLARDPVPHLDGATVAAFYGAAAVTPPAGLVLSDTLVTELCAADHLLIASPMYNFTIASTLKAWIDHVVRSGRTFTVQDRRPVGLLREMSATIVTARGGLPANDDFNSDYLRAILGFVGISRIDVVAVDGTAQDEATRAQRLEHARASVDRLFAG